MFTEKFNIMTDSVGKRMGNQMFLDESSYMRSPKVCSYTQASKYMLAQSKYGIFLGDKIVFNDQASSAKSTNNFKKDNKGFQQEFEKISGNLD